MFKKILLSLIILILFSNSSTAVTNTLVTLVGEDAYSINPTYDPSNFLLLSGINTTTSVTETWSIDGGGTFTTSNVRINEVTSTNYRGFYSVEDPDECTLSGICRIIFLLSDGVATTRLAYTDNSTLQDIGKGIYTTSNPTGYHVIATYSGSYVTPHIVLNSIGDIITVDQVNKRVIVYDKSNLYASTILYTISGTDVDAYTGTTNKFIFDVSVDASDNIYVYMGNQTASANAGAGVIVLDSDGNTLQTFPDIQGAGVGGASAKSEGCIIPDITNSTTNFHIGFTNSTVGNIYHYNGTGLELISTGTDQILDCTYMGGNIWYTTDASTVETVATSYQGFEANQPITGTPENTYNIKQIGSVYDNYYNNSNFLVNFNINVQTNAVRELDSVASRALYGYGVTQNYIWKITLIDTNGIQVQNYFTEHCEDNLLLTECSLSGSLEYKPPKTNWTEGTYYAELWEYNQQNFNYALITTSDTWNVGNNSTTPIDKPTEPITSGTGENTLTQIDGWVGLLGLGVNSISKFLFAMILTLSVTFFGFIGTKGNSMGGAIAGALPFTFFVFIEFIPVWTIIIVVMVVAIKTGWFR